VTVIVSVRLHDDGGTVYGGQDTSAPQTFNITVTQAALVVEAGGSLVTGEEGAQATFTVALAAKPSGEVTIVLDSTDSSEGTVSPTTLVFTPDNWNVAQTVTVTGVDDGEQDGDIAYQVTLDASSSADTSYRLATASVDLTNRDNDEQQGQFIFLPLVVR
jgi:large repetitive protein